MGANPSALLRRASTDRIAAMLKGQQATGSGDSEAIPVDGSGYNFNPHFTGGARDVNPNISLPPPQGYLNPGNPGVDYDHSIIGGEWSSPGPSAVNPSSGWGPGMGLPGGPITGFGYNPPTGNAPPTAVPTFWGPSRAGYDPVGRQASAANGIASGNPYTVANKTAGHSGNWWVF